MNAIEIRHLSKTYVRKRLLRTERLPALEDLNLDIRSGEVFAFLGPNGSGKTTTIKLILGLLFPTSGEIRILGERVPSRRAQALVGYLPEAPYLYPHLTARETLELYGRLSGLSGADLDRRISAALDQVRMSRRAGDALSEFSKGMLQRIAIAQALLHDPKILLFDEPITGLDPIGLKEMRDLILSLKQRGKTVFFSSHIIAEAEKICDRAAILFRGRLVEMVEKMGDGSLEDRFLKAVGPLGAGEIY